MPLYQIGFLIPAFDVEMFTNSLKRLMKDESLRKMMGDKGMLKSQLYHIDSIGKQWKQLFDELIHNNEV